MSIKVITIPWFWLNYVVLLLITLPFPILEITVNGKRVRTASIFECYSALIKLKTDPKILFVILLHILLTFFICIVVWTIVFKTSKKKLSKDEETSPTN
ncbi:MAG: hypothetical protein N3G21_00385 [Candidatus Hydrogenedentes bacterium]|nr:hypothetical protein [Candidatus Hydrogenedentota bacterium]